MSSTPGPTSTPVNSGSSSSSTVTISSILNSVRAEFPGHRGPDKVKPLSKAANDTRRDDDKEWCDHQKRLEFLRKEAENLENTNWMYESVDKLLGMGNPGFGPSPGSIYFSGKDEFKIMTRSTINPSPVPISVNSAFVDVICKTNIELIVYRKSYDSHAWLAKGFGIGCTTEKSTSDAGTDGSDFQYSEVEIFPSQLQITNVTESPGGVIGLSTATNTFYQCVFNFDADLDQFNFSREEVKVKQHQPMAAANEEDAGTSTEAREERIYSANAKFTHLVSEDTEVYAVDETGSIYNVLKDKLVWKLPSGKITKLVCGFSHNLLLTDTGAVYGWGNGSRGQLGQDVIILSCPTPQRIEFFDDLPCVVTDIATGGWHTLALTSDGDVYSWGWNESNQLGLPSEMVPSVQGTPYPVDLGSSSNPITAIAAGSRHSVVQMKDGSVYAWGFNKFGQLGLGDTVNRKLPAKLKLELKSRNLSLSKEEQRPPNKIICGRWCTFIVY